MDHSPNNSSGVQMTGHSKPCCLQMAATDLEMIAFAICTQFQVTSKSIAWTDAIAKILIR